MSTAWFNLRISPSVSQHLENTSFSADAAAALDGHLPFGTLKTEETRTVSILEPQGNLRNVVGASTDSGQRSACCHVTRTQEHGKGALTTW